MKKFAVLIFMALLLPVQAMAVEKWKEGEHYRVLDKPATAKPEIREYFSYWCPHCFNFEPLVAQMKEKMGSGTTFTKVQVNFMGFTSQEIQDDATRAMMIARATKQEDKFNKAIFSYIHQQRASIASLQDLRNVFVVNGMEGTDFDKLASSFGVNGLLKKNNKMVAEYRSVLKSVPTFIVNGKYMATFTRDMTPDDMVDLVVWLTEMK